MRKQDLEAAIVEAERFLARARDLLESPLDKYGHLPPVKTAAVRRASMDLTRSLPPLRRYS